MKTKFCRTFTCFLLGILFFTSCGAESAEDMSSAPPQNSVFAEESSGESSGTKTVVEKEKPAELRGVWFSYFEMERLFKNQSEVEARANVEQAFAQAEDLFLTDLFVHVRPFADVLYQSNMNPSSHILSGVQGYEMAYDPLEIMVSVAHEKGLRLHAWVNPYRVQEGKNPPSLCPNSTPSRWLAEGSDNIIRTESGIYLNPSRKEVSTHVIKSVMEIVDNYDIDGVHLDDYFYKETDTAFDEAAFLEAKFPEESLAAFRRRQVNEFVETLRAEILEAKSNILFGISVASNIEKNQDELYADVKAWLASDRYVDYLIPQIYHGFLHETFAFETVLSNWAALRTDTNVSLYVGLSVYKAGEKDVFAGESGKNEWVTTHDIIARQIVAMRNSVDYSGFALYRFDSLFHPADTVREAVLEEEEYLKKLLAE